MADTLLNYAAQVKDLKRQKIVQIFGTSSNILRLLNFIDLGDAMGYEYDRQQALPGVGFRAINGAYPDQPEGVIVPVKEGTAIMGGLVYTDRQLALNASRKAARVAAKVQAAGLFFTRIFFDGDSSRSALEFDGLNARLGSGQQTIKGGSGSDGGALNLDAVAALCDLVVGDDDGETPSNKVLLMGTAMRRELGKMIRAAGNTYILMADWASTYAPTSYNNVPIKLVGRDESDNFILGFDETVGITLNCGSMYCVAFGRQMDEDRLQGICRMGADGMFEVEEQGVRGTQDQALVEGRVGLATFHGRSIARYYGITPDITASQGGVYAVKMNQARALFTEGRYDEAKELIEDCRKLRDAAISEAARTQVQVPADGSTETPKNGKTKK
jgi:hypothetical protein